MGTGECSQHTGSLHHREKIRSSLLQGSMGLLGAAWEMPQCLWGRSHSTSLNFRAAEVAPWHSLLNRVGGEDGQSGCQYKGNSIGFRTLWQNAWRK